MHDADKILLAVDLDSDQVTYWCSLLLQINGQLGDADDVDEFGHLNWLQDEAAAVQADGLDLESLEALITDEGMSKFKTALKELCSGRTVNDIVVEYYAAVKRAELPTTYVGDEGANYAVMPQIYSDPLSTGRVESTGNEEWVWSETYGRYYRIVNGESEWEEVEQQDWEEAVPSVVSWDIPEEESKTLTDGEVQLEATSMSSNAAKDESEGLIDDDAQLRELERKLKELRSWG